MKQKLLLTAILGFFLSFATMAQQESVRFGKEISEEGALIPAEFLKEMESKIESETKVKAKVTNVCRMKGCWMTLDMGHGKEVMVRFKDYGFFVPKNVTGKTAVVEGRAYMDTVSVETLRHYAEDEGKSETEIKAITKPEIRVSFIADGVIIEE